MKAVFGAVFVVPRSTFDSETNDGESKGESKFEPGSYREDRRLQKT